MITCSFSLSHMEQKLITALLWIWELIIYHIRHIPGTWDKDYSFRLMEQDVYWKRGLRALHWLPSNFYLKWTWVWANSRRWYRQGSLASGNPWSHRVRHNLATEQQCKRVFSFLFFFQVISMILPWEEKRRKLFWSKLLGASQQHFFFFFLSCSHLSQQTQRCRTLS